MPGILPQVRAYHPRIGVRCKDGSVQVIKADLPDFALPDEILGAMGHALSVRTAGEVVEAIRSKKRHQLDDWNCSIEHTAYGENLPVVEWDHEVT